MPTAVEARRTRGLGPWILAAGLPIVMAVGALPATGQPAGGFEETIDVNLVNLDVFVTDKDGRPVTGLSADDFTVQLDGDRVKSLDYFDEAGPSTPPQPTPSAAVERSGVAAAVGTPLRLAVVVDNRNILPANRKRILDELRSFLLPRLAPGTDVPGMEVMVLTQDQGLNVRQTFSSDPELLGRTFDQVESLPPARFVREAERQAVLASIQTVVRLLAENSSAGRQFAASEAESAMRQIVVYADSARKDVVDTVDSLKQVVRALGSLDGRKALVYVSDGLPVRPGDSLATALQNSLRDGRSLEGLEAGGDGSRAGSGGGDDFGGDASSSGSTPRPLSMQVGQLRNELTPYDTTAVFLELTALANARRVTFYPVNGAGGDIAALGADSRSDVGSLASPSTFLIADQIDVRDSLRLLAEETGGRALVGGTDVDGWLVGVEQDLRSYYSMAFSSPQLADGKVHKVKIKVKGRGRDVRYRQSFVAREAASLQPDRTSAALLLGIEENPHGLEVVVEGEQQREDGTYQVNLLLRVPMARLAFVPTGAEQKAQLQVYFSIAGADGRVTPAASFPLDLAVPADQLEAARAQHYGARLPVVMTPGPQRFAIGVWDAGASLGSYLAAEVEVGAQTGGTGPSS